MDFLFFLLGWGAGLYSISNLTVALFFFIPYAKKHAHLHNAAPWTNKLMELFDGPVPYGLILAFPCFATILLAIGLFFVVEQNFHPNLIIGGVLTSILMSLISLRDTKGNHKRCFNQSWGKRYSSLFFGEKKLATLYDEQLFKDLPMKVKNARDELLRNEGDGDGDESLATEALISIISEYSRPENDSVFQGIHSSLNPEAGPDNLADYEKRRFSSKDHLIFPKALLRVTVRVRHDNSRSYHFTSTV